MRSYTNQWELSRHIGTLICSWTQVNTFYRRQSKFPSWPQQDLIFSGGGMDTKISAMNPLPPSLST